MAIDRHKFTKIHIKQNKGKCWNTTILPIIEKSFNDRFIFTRDGDRLDNLSNTFYKDPRHWIILALANNLGKGTLAVPAGIQLRIPPYSVVTTLKERLRKTEEGR
jgi:hypothetical protein